MVYVRVYNPSGKMHASEIIKESVGRKKAERRKRPWIYVLIYLLNECKGLKKSAVLLKLVYVSLSFDVIKPSRQRGHQ